MGKGDQAAAELEEAFRRNIPQARSKGKPEAAWAEALKRFHAEARVIRKRHSLGVLGRASAAYRLQQRLIAAGYPPDAVRQVIFSTVVNAFIGKE